MGLFSRLVFGVVAALAVAAPVSASGHCDLTVAHIEGGAAFHRVSGSGFVADEEVELQLYFDNEAVFLAPVLKTADGDGKFFDGLSMLPKDPVGTYTMRATAASCDAQTTFVWALPDTAVELPATAGQMLSIPALTWVLVAGTLAFAYFLISPRWTGALSRNTLPDTAARLPTPVTPSPPTTSEVKWAVVAGVLIFAYALISPRWGGARSRNSD